MSLSARDARAIRAALGTFRNMASSIITGGMYERSMDLGRAESDAYRKLARKKRLGLVLNGIYSYESELSFGRVRVTMERLVLFENAQQWRREVQAKRVSRG